MWWSLLGLGKMAGSKNKSKETTSLTSRKELEEREKWGDEADKNIWGKFAEDYFNSLKPVRYYKIGQSIGQALGLWK